jgi:glycosyltransferase involved in cell wall biosynthesis
MSNAHIIPNGVDLSRFKPIPKQEARKHINYPEELKIVLFISKPNRPEKNVELAERAVKALNNNFAEFKHICNVPNSEIPFYLGAADVLLLTSKWEGSVNVIKEAMACNCPVVTTPVGDTTWVIGDTEGCYLSTFEEGDIAANIEKAFTFGRRTKGRERILKLGLDSQNIAERIIGVYNEVLQGKNRKRA